MTLLKAVTAPLMAIAASALLIAPAYAQKAPAKPAAKSAPAKKAAPATAKKPAKTKKAKKAKSACQGLSQSRCSAAKACGWVKPKKAVDTRGRKLKAYCRKTARIAKKKKSASAAKAKKAAPTKAKVTAKKSN